MKAQASIQACFRPKHGSRLTFRPGHPLTCFATRVWRKSWSPPCSYLTELYLWALMYLQKSTCSSLSWAACADSRAALPGNLSQLTQSWISTRGSTSTTRAAEAWLGLHAASYPGWPRQGPRNHIGLVWRPGLHLYLMDYDFFPPCCLRSCVLPPPQFCSSQWITSFMHRLLPRSFLSKAQRGRHWSEFFQAKEGPAPQSPPASRVWGHIIPSCCTFKAWMQAFTFSKRFRGWSCTYVKALLEWGTGFWIHQYAQPLLWAAYWINTIPCLSPWLSGTTCQKKNRAQTP